MTAWVAVTGPPGGAVTALGALDAQVVALTGAGWFATVDHGGTWAPLRERAVMVTEGGEVVAPGAGAPAGSPSATARAEVTTAVAALGDRVWAARRATWLGAYRAPGPGGAQFLHHAAQTEGWVEVSDDDGATWRRIGPPVVARGLALDDAGRAWIAADDALHVAEPGALAWRVALPRPTTDVAVDAAGRVVVAAPTASFVSTDGARFDALPPRAVEHGAWGSLDIDVTGLRALRRAPDGGVWGIADGGVVRLADGRRGRPAWRSVNLGLTVLPGVGSRPARVTALAFAPDGAAWCATAGHGLHRYSHG